MKIFLGDLVHNWSGSGIWTIPLNCGFVASFSTKKLLEENINSDYKLYKDPKKILDDIKTYKPDVIGLSFYVWNENLNKHIFDTSSASFQKHMPLFIKCKPHFP